jgi:hypothetical protein
MTTIPKSIELKDLLEPLKANTGSAQSTSSPETHDDDTMVHHEDHVQRPSVRGPYRPVRNGTIRGSIFALLTSALGTGCLSLPYRASKVGIIPFIILTLLCALLAYVGMYFM